MAYRILNYCVEIIRNVVEEKNVNKAEYKYPIVIPIVLYTGKQKWTASTSFAKSQIMKKDIKTKCKKFEEVTNNLIRILRNTQKGKQQEELKRIVLYLYEDMKEDGKREIIKLIEESKCEGNMFTAKKIINAEIRKERKEGITQGILKGIKQTIERMIKMNLEDEFIKQATGADETEIQKIRKELRTESSK